jgi:hypothetical protein
MAHVEVGHGEAEVTREFKLEAVRLIKDLRCSPKETRTLRRKLSHSSPYK